MNKQNSRAVVAKILSELLSGSGSLSTQLGKHKTHIEFSLIQETCYGCCRWFHLLEQLLSQLLSKPLKAKDQDIKCLLIAGLYQLRELEVAEYAVINESVSAAEHLGRPWAKAMVNAVLRNYVRKKDALEQTVLSHSAGQYSHPAWLLAEINSQWPDQADQIFQNNNKRPPMTLRVNRLQKSRAEYLDLLNDAGIEAIPGEVADSAVYLAQATDVASIPGFSEGWVSVQDEASQLVPGLLQLEPGLRLLDACAAPGGKTCHILESEPSLTGCTAIDISQRKLDRIGENLERLHLDADLVPCDASDIDRWWDGEKFDRILLDAPCSATGIIRRHPDIKLLRTPEQIESLLHSQRKLLRSLWQCLKPGGLLLYTTCSVLRQENDTIIADFLDSSDNAKYQGITADWGVECDFGRQLLPGANQSPDGFFFSLLKKLS